MTTLTRQALGGLALLIAVLGAILFGPAMTFDYWQAWVFLAVFSSEVIAITIHLMRHDPALLARRVKAGPMAETERRQQVITGLASLVFVALFVVSALDHRGHWSSVPSALVVAGDALVFAGLFVVFLVFRANTYTSTIIEVGRDQKLVSTGPYAVVRHPMYAGALIMLLGAPIALGSWWGLVAVPVMTAVLVWRLVDEEQLLAMSLPGYVEYRARVRYRLVPRVW